MSVPLYVNLQERLRVEREEAQAREEQIRVLCKEYYDLKKQHEHVLAENARLAEQHRQMSASLTETQTKSADMEMHLEESRTHVAELQNDLEAANSDLDAARQHEDQLNTQISQLRDERFRLLAQAETTNQEMRKLRKELKQAQADIEHLRHTLQETEHKRGEIESLYGEDKDRIDRMRKLVDAKDRQRLRAEELKKKADTECEAHKKRERLIEFHLKQVTDALKELEGKYEDLLGRNRTLHNDNRKVTTELGQLLKKEASRERQLSQLWTEVEYWKNVVARTDKAEEAFQQLAARMAEQKQMAMSTIRDSQVLLQGLHGGYVDAGFEQGEVMTEEEEVLQEEGEVIDVQYYEGGEQVYPEDQMYLAPGDEGVVHEEQHGDGQVPYMDSLTVAEVTCGAFLNAMETIENEAHDASKHDLNPAASAEALRARAASLRLKNTSLLRSLQERTQMLKATVTQELV